MYGESIEKNKLDRGTWVLRITAQLDSWRRTEHNITHILCVVLNVYLVENIMSIVFFPFYILNRIAFPNLNGILKLTI